MMPSTLYRHEMSDLLEALRRDMRAELDRAESDPQWAEFHRTNARHDRHLLEVLNPKGSGKRIHTVCATKCPYTSVYAELPAPGTKH